MARTTSSRAGAGLVVALLTAATLVGCGGGGGQDGVGGESGGSTPPQRSSSGPAPDRGPGSRPGASPSPSPSATVSAADGADVGACADGTCEIAVAKPVTIPFDGPSGRATLALTEVAPNRVAYEVKSGNGTSKGSAGGPGQGCITVIRANGGGNSCGRVDSSAPEGQPDAVVIQVAAGADGTALLHFVSD